MIPFRAIAAALFALAALSYLAAWAIDRAAGEELLPVTAADETTVAANRGLWELNDRPKGEVAAIYGTPAKNPVRIVFASRARVLRPKEDPALALYVMPPGDHPLQAQTLYFFALPTARPQQPRPVKPPGGNVRDWGAKADGSDDWRSIQNAVDAGGHVQFPPGTYHITRPVVIDLDRVGPVAITGSAARVVMDGEGPAFKFVGTHAGMTVPVAKGLFNQLQQLHRPDVIVAELGDGILGEYGVQDILRDPELAQAGRAWVMAAPDPVGCWGADQLMRGVYGLPITVLTGPATDNQVGRDYINASLGIPAHNALRDAAGLLEVVAAALEAA